ncbi:MAG: TonB-dependent receptor [Acidobacteriota bacterium]
MRSPWRQFLILMMLSLMPVGGWAQTTGGIVGHVEDESGAVLPGVAIQVESPALQGTRTASTDISGVYRIMLLPPGEYKLTFSLAGFTTEVAEGLIVSLDRETTLNQVMKVARTAETVTVVAEAAVVSTTSTTLGSNFSDREIETLPTGRNYSAVVQVAPGTSSDANWENESQSTVTVYGSSGAENAFFIDGVNTTGVEYGFQGKDLNFEFIQEIDVKTGGYEAEYGKSTGGIINVITKSGGNDFHGDIFTYYDNDGLQSSPREVVSPRGTVEGFTKQDYGADLSGYIVRDKLWFFAAIDRVSNTTDNKLPEGGPKAGEIVKSDSTRTLGSFKVTYNLKEGHSLIGTYFQDPRTDTGAISDADHTLNGDPLTYMGEQEYGGRDFAVRYEGLVGSSWLFSAQVARHAEKNNIGPESGAGDIIEYRDAENNYYQTGGFGLVQEKEFSRTFLGATATRFFKNHEFKMGFEYEIEKADVMKRMSGGQRVDILANPADPSKPVYRHFYWTTPDATIQNAPTSALNAPPEHKNTTLFFQDRWNLTTKLTVNAGLRWDRQEIFDRFGDRQIDLWKDLAPRVGFIFDPKADAHSRIFGSYGRYYEQIPMDLVIRSFTQERQAAIYNYDPVSVTPDPQAEADIDDNSKILGGYTEPADPDLRNQYMNEFILGYEHEVRANMAVGVKGIYRYYGRVIEDFLGSSDGTYYIGNPGKGFMKEIWTLDYAHTYPAPKPERVYKGIQIDVNKRFSNNWQGLVSYIYSRIDGNFDGEYAPFTNVGADPNISATYDYYDFFTDGRDLSKITNDGPLSNDRHHQFKFSGVYMTPYRISIGVSGYVRSGLPITRYGYSDAYGRYEFFLTKRGAEGRTPVTYETDLHVGYPIQIGAVSINLMGDIFSLFNARRAVLLDQRWGFQEADNASPTPVNPDYLKPVLRTPPRTLRLGLRISF